MVNTILDFKFTCTGELFHPTGVLMYGSIDFADPTWRNMVTPATFTGYIANSGLPVDHSAATPVYADKYDMALTNFPSIASGMISNLNGLESFHTFTAGRLIFCDDTVVQDYKGTSCLFGPKEYINTATTTSGVATFSLVDDTGVAIFNNVYYQKAEVNDSANSYNYSYSLSGDKKTLTVTVTRSAPTGVISLLGLNLLSAPSATPNGTSVNILVKGN